MAELGERIRAETFENLGFSFCRIATVALLTGRWCLPIASGLCALFFLLAHLGGKRDTRCLLRHPILAAAVYGVVCAGAVWWNLRR